jgi:hypothetical protein
MNTSVDVMTHGLLVSHRPYVQHPPIKRHFSHQLTSHWCISPMGQYIKIQINPFYTKSLNEPTHGCVPIAIHVHNICGICTVNINIIVQTTPFNISVYTRMKKMSMLPLYVLKHPPYWCRANRASWVS